MRQNSKIKIHLLLYFANLLFFPAQMFFCLFFKAVVLFDAFPSYRIHHLALLRCVIGY